MTIRRMTDAVKNAAEAYRRTREVFAEDPTTEMVCWPAKSGFLWVRATPGMAGHLSGREEPKPKLYDFEVQRAKSESSDAPPPEDAWTGALKAWAEEHVRLSPRNTT